MIVAVVRSFFITAIGRAARNTGMCSCSGMPHAVAAGAIRARRRRHEKGETWARTAPSHLVAIGLDARGLPVSLFTVNRWVTAGHWFDAATTLGLVHRFSLQGVPGHEDSCAWVSGFVPMYEPVIRRLLAARDIRLARLGPLNDALEDRRVDCLEPCAAGLGGRPQPTRTRAGPALPGSG